MTGVVTAITVLSCSLFACALIKMLAPNGNTEKILRLVISIFMLICIVTCFKEIGDVMDFANLEAENAAENAGNIESAVNETVLKTTGDYMAEYVNSLLLAEDINAELVEVTVNTDENSVIMLNDVSIYIDKSNRLLKGRITEIIETDLDITPKVIIKEQ